MKRLAIITICIFILLLTACSKEPSIYVDKDDSPLMIYIWDGDVAMKHHINTYNSLFNEVQIEYDAFTLKDLRNMKNLIVNEIPKGNGPDLIKIDNIFFAMDINKMIEDNLFAELNEFIDRSQTFDKSLYNNKMLDAAIIDGNRYFIPISYNMDFLIVYS